MQRWIAARQYVRAHNRRLPASAATLHFYPMLPDGTARVSTILARLGLRIGTDERPDSPTIAWDTGTWFDERAQRRLPPGAINAGCMDISKGHVDRTWASVAGYSVEVDPLTFEGPLVVKSEINGRHDGRLAKGPLATRLPGFVYERFVDAVEGDNLVDLRTAIVGAHIPVLWRRFHSRRRWFDPANGSPLADPAQEFSALELNQLLRFATLIGLEYGELDVLRDKGSGRIYVLDANRTPQGPADAEGPTVSERATNAMTEAFGALLAERWP